MHTSAFLFICLILRIEKMFSESKQFYTFKQLSNILSVLSSCDLYIRNVLLPIRFKEARKTFNLRQKVWSFL